jgi:predicted nucleic acid-binding protein
MIVVADSGPLHYLILLEHADLLRILYDRVAIPDAVVSELRAAGAPERVREWVSAPPPWTTIVTVNQSDIAHISEVLDLGERAAIALAQQIQADLLLIDETAGRAEARRLNLRITGTLGVLRAAAEAGLIDVHDVIIRLRETSFYVDDSLLRKVFEPWS